MSSPAQEPATKPAKTGASPSLGKTFSLVAVLTFLSKFAGLARDVVVAQAVGTSMIADAYNNAYLLTGNVLILFGGLGGPFHSSAVAILEPKKESPSMGRLVFQLLACTCLLLGLVSALAWLTAPNLVLLAINYLHLTPERQELLRCSANLFQIMLPLILISGIVGILYGVSNVYNEVFWPSLSPAIASLAIIAAIVAFPAQASGPQALYCVGLCLAYGTLAGAVGQMLAQLPATFKHVRLQLSFASEPGVKQYAAMLWPAALSTSIGQLTVYVDWFFTFSLQTGAWTAINYSNRLVQLPLGILITAMIVPILPRFTKRVSDNQIAELKDDFRKAVSFMWFVSLPMTAILLAIPSPIIQLLFERGKFDAHSRELVTIALLFLVPQIFFYVARDLITRVFYAHQDSKSPYLVAMAAIVLKALLDWALVGPLGVGGISLATTLITIFNLTFLAILLRKKIGNLGLTKVIKPVTIMITASAIAGLATYFCQAWLASATINLPQLISLIVSVGVSCSLSIIVYLSICLALKLEEPTLLMERIRGKAVRG